MATVATATTSIGISNIFDVSGHTANLYLGTLNIHDTQNRAGSGTDIFSFNAGTLDVTGIRMSHKIFL